MSTPIALNEDTIYRTSTQYRLWSFSPEQLTRQRQETHELARTRAQQYTTTNAHNPPQHDDTTITNATSPTSAPNGLTELEELRLVRRYCEVIMVSCRHMEWPINVQTTAIQYLKRFYLSNSCVTYPPKEIYKTVLFLASKTEAIHVPLSKFCRLMSERDPDSVLAPEYKVMQALRFTLDVRQPFRGLKGTLMEMLNMAEGLVGSTNEQAGTGDEVEKRLFSLSPPRSANTTLWKPRSGAGATVSKEEAVERVQLAYAASKDILDKAASLTDAYFLYTPSQILLAALRMADAPLLDLYMEIKLPMESPTRPKILATIQSCAELLAAYDPQDSMSKDERAALEKKLDACRDPATKDLTKAHAAAKRMGTEDEKLDEQEAKRRKLERQKSNKEMDDLFGPSLAAPKIG